MQGTLIGESRRMVNKPKNDRFLINKKVATISVGNSSPTAFPCCQRVKVPLTDKVSVRDRHTRATTTSETSSAGRSHQKIKEEKLKSGSKAKFLLSSYSNAFPKFGHTEKYS